MEIASCSAGSDVQVSPSGEAMAEPPPTATKPPGPEATSSNEFPPGVLACAVHEMPSVEVVTAATRASPPVQPTATRRVPDHATPLSIAVVPDERWVQTKPSGEVTMVPAIPTATNWVPVQTTAESPPP